MKVSQNLAHLTLALTTLMVSSVSCGPQAYQKTASTEEQLAPGTFSVPAKVDILLVEDDTGSMMSGYSTIQAQLPAFLNNLTTRGWDYHFATAPLTTLRPINQVQASRYDGNWGSQWLPSYPGALPNAAGMVVPSAFRFPPTSQKLAGEYSDFLLAGQFNNTLNGYEPGFQTIKDTLLNSNTNNTGFMRPDALLVVLVIGNGNDTSGVNFCTRNDGWVGTCANAGFAPCTFSGQTNCDSNAQSFNNFRTAFQAIKPYTQQLKWYSAVAAADYTSCYGSRAYTGTRYQQMATALGGQSFDVCSGAPLGNILDSVAGSLHAVKLNFRTKYLFVAQEPNPATISITRHSGGVDSQIPQDPTNGWTYAGQVTNVFTIDSPILMNRASGWAIELHGSAKLVGDETATVTFDPAGVHDAVAH